MILIVNITIDFKQIEKKWQKKWLDSKIFEANIQKNKPKFFVTFPYPYVNGAPHIGHIFTSFRVDSYARFKRMQGYNVLFPQGFHATGEPILGLVERLRKGDEVQIRTMKLFGATDEEIEKMKEDPKFVALFWMKRWKEDLKRAGFGIDWRRSFITTSMNPQYSRFIEWQYEKLKELGYIIQGSHPVVWCPHCKSPTGDHDRVKGEGEGPIEYILVKFKLKDTDVFLPCGTLRPETVYGVTNIWINPNEEYIQVRVNGEKWILSRKTIEKLKDQLKEIVEEKAIKGEELVGKRAIEPIHNKEIPILPAKFVDPENATGIVMSVPSHAPYDWIGLKEILENKELLERFGISEDGLKPISIIKVEGFGEHPAIEICEKLDIKSSVEKEKLEEATSVVYKKEFHKGILKENCGKYSGKRVSEVKEEIIKDFIERKIADKMWELTGEVICRCGTKCHVKVLENQWFLKYSDEIWKKLARKVLENIRIVPKEAEENFKNTIDWLKDKACARKTGLGTPLPWDKEWIIEPLSDSTIYMAYYTIARIINEKNIPAEKLTNDVFDYIFLGKGNLEEISRKSNLDKKTIEEMKKEFEYFYPVDFRNSGKDLVQNHLTFYIFHHVAIWKDFPDKWPRGIGVNGFVNVEGEKMSKSKGNIIPLRDLVGELGSDLVRINIITAAEGLEDPDWRIERIESFKKRLIFVWELIEKIKNAKRTKIQNIDKFLVSKLSRHIKKSTEFYENLMFRSASQECMFYAINDLKWYIERVGRVENSNKKIIKKYLEVLVKLMCPLVPHFSEELWEKLGHKKFLATSKWPTPKRKIDEVSIQKEEFLKNLMSDIREIIEMKNQKPKKISIFVAHSWKFSIYREILKNKNLKIEDAFKIAKLKDKSVANYVNRLKKKIFELEQEVLERKNQFSILEEAKEFLERIFDCEVEIIDSEKSNHQKAIQSLPTKPGIHIEWKNI